MWSDDDLGLEPGSQAERCPDGFARFVADQEYWSFGGEQLFVQQFYGIVVIEGGSAQQVGQRKPGADRP